jgi:hypothetical protein
VRTERCVAAAILIDEMKLGPDLLGNIPVLALFGPGQDGTGRAEFDR